MPSSSATAIYLASLATHLSRILHLTFLESFISQSMFLAWLMLSCIYNSSLQSGLSAAGLSAAGLSVACKRWQGLLWDAIMSSVAAVLVPDCASVLLAPGGGAGRES